MWFLIVNTTYNEIRELKSCGEKLCDCWLISMRLVNEMGAVVERETTYNKQIKVVHICIVLWFLFICGMRVCWTVWLLRKQEKKMEPESRNFDHKKVGNWLLLMQAKLAQFKPKNITEKMQKVENLNRKNITVTHQGFWAL